MKRYNLTASDWSKLQDYSTIFSREILEQLPSDYIITLTEVQSAYFDSIFHLAEIYRKNPQDDGLSLSFTSYCYKYAKTHTLRNLFRDYRRMKYQESEYDLADITTKELSLSTKLFCEDLLDKMDDKDRHIAEMIMEGYSYEEIGKEMGISKMAISKRIKKYRKL